MNSRVLNLAGPGRGQNLLWNYMFSIIWSQEYHEAPFTFRGDKRLVFASMLRQKVAGSSPSSAMCRMYIPDAVHLAPHSFKSSTIATSKSLNWRSNLWITGHSDAEFASVLVLSVFSHSFWHRHIGRIENNSILKQKEQSSTFGLSAYRRQTWLVPTADVAENESSHVWRNGRC